MEIKVCPSCGGTDIEVAGNKVHCRGCDVTYKVTPEGSRVDNVDPLGKDRERIKKLEAEVEDLKKRGSNGQASQEDEGDDEQPGESDNDGIVKITDDDEPEADVAGDAGE